MTREEFAAYREHLVTSYAQDMFDAGAFADLPTALTASEQSTRDLLPEGPDTPGHHLWSAVDGDTGVGILWIHAEGATAFIYDIEVRAEHRRRGYGQEILDAGAVAARALGADALGLNVFGHNEGARALYERAGYDTTEQTFRISLQPGQR
jgi:ribosomal protein S18 acetylase RimI-like enzyme